MPDAVIFDVDGTLIDSVDAHAHAWQQAFAEFGHATDFAAIRAQIGKGGDKLLPHFLSPAEVERDGKAIEARRAALMQQLYMPHLQAFPGVRPLVQHILAAGMRVALASSAKRDELETYERLARIGDLIQADTSSDDARHSKPDPDVIEAALRKLAPVDPAAVIMVGDSPYDAQAARRAGVRMVGVRCGGFPDDELRAAGCIALFDGPADLLARFAESPLAGR